MELRELLTQVFAGSLSAQIELISAFQDCGYNIKIEKIKEEKKMMNFDKYREDIREDIRNYPLMNIECYLAELRGELRGVEKCKRAKCEECLKNSLRWLFSEYEPPLLENGDELKPGDWIMVRNSDEDKWSKEQFLFYYPYSSSDRNFACAYHDGVIGDGDYFTWKQARIPEDGE